jgi:hypothetical protein
MEITNKTKIEDCEISVRLINYLKTNGIDTIEDLIRKEPLFFAKKRFRVSVVKALENFMKENNLHFNGIDKKTDIDWEQRRYELSKAAMQGFEANTSEMVNTSGAKKIVEWSIQIADEMIKQLKESEETK